MSTGRPPWAEVWVGMLGVLKKRSTCPRLSTSCVIVTGDNRLLTAGYNGAPYGRPHCEDVGCQIFDNHCVRSVHAEINAVALAARSGTRLMGATAYCLDRPCAPCLNALVQAGVERVLYVREGYDPQATDGVLWIARDCNVPVERVPIQVMEGPVEMPREEASGKVPFVWKRQPALMPDHQRRQVVINGVRYIEVDT